MGSLCCVAASPNEPKAGGSWSMVQNEPYWQTNASFSPPPSRWDFSLPSEDLPCNFRDTNLLHQSLTSSRSKESRLMTGNCLRNNHCSAVDHTGFIPNISNVSPIPQWTPPEIQEIRANNNEAAAGRGSIMQLLPSVLNVEGTSENLESGGSSSNGNEYEPKFRLCNFSSTRPYLSKPVQPLVFPAKPSGTESTLLSSSSDAPTLGSAGSSIDIVDVSDPFESEILGRLCISSDGYKCGLCERLLSQRSPWSTRRIMTSGDMPVTGVLSCSHVFHVECLEQTTLKVHKSDPPCPICHSSEDRKPPELKFFPSLRNNVPNLRPSSVYGTSNAPQKFILNGNQMRKNESLKSKYPTKDFLGKARKSGTYSLKLQRGNYVDLGTVGYSNAIAGPGMKK